MPNIRLSVFTIKNLNGHGSGFLAAGGGWLLTNAHVVDDEEYVAVKPIGVDKEIPGRVMIVCEKQDVALIKIASKRRLAPLPINRSLPRVGEDVYVFGTPLYESLEGTLTRGVVSAIRKEDGMEYIQSDVTIHPGNSGGPLMDKHGNVVGIVVKGVASGDSMANLNLFIPIKAALASLDLRIEESESDSD